MLGVFAKNIKELIKLYRIFNAEYMAWRENNDL